MPKPEHRYAPPLDRLFKLRPPASGESEWHEYAALGIGPEHIPELVRMATDRQLLRGQGKRAWAPVHAWRALGQLRAEEAISPLADVLAAKEHEDDDWIHEEVPVVLARIGPAAIPALEAVAEAGRRKDDRPHFSALDGLEKMAKWHPETRGAILSFVRAELERFAENGRDRNGYLVAILMGLEDVDAAPLMERAFAAGAVAHVVAGDWEDVQIGLGLKRERETPSPNYLYEDLRERWRRAGERIVIVPPKDDEDDDGGWLLPAPESSRSAAKAKARRRQQRQSRRKNRRRK